MLSSTGYIKSKRRKHIIKNKEYMLQRWDGYNGKFFHDNKEKHIYIKKHKKTCSIKNHD